MKHKSNENELEMAQQVDAILSFYVMKFTTLKNSWKKR